MTLEQEYAEATRELEALSFYAVFGPAARRPNHRLMWTIVGS